MYTFGKCITKAEKRCDGQCKTNVGASTDVLDNCNGRKQKFDTWP